MVDGRPQTDTGRGVTDKGRSEYYHVIERHRLTGRYRAKRLEYEDG